MSLLNVIVLVVLAGGVTGGVQCEIFVKVVKLKIDTSLFYVQISPHLTFLSVAIFVKAGGILVLCKVAPFRSVRLRIDYEVTIPVASEMESILVKARKNGGGLIVLKYRFYIAKLGVKRS